MVSVKPENMDTVDTPEKMYGLNTAGIIKLRYSLVRTKLNQSIFSKDRYISELQDVVLAKKPTDLEVNFSKKPTFSSSFSPLLQPMGLSGELKTLKLAQNPSIGKSVYRLVEDELTATDTAIEFYKLGTDVSKISKILSSGVLGKAQKKLVPTRWSITAVDDMLGKHIILQIKDSPTINEVLLYENTYLDNHFYIILMPGSWEFEQIETWFPQTLWNKGGVNEPQFSVESEFYFGRKKYAITQSGGYYAARFGVLEGLKNMGRQARSMVIREIYEGYDIPVGVWEVRENVRNAFRNPPKKFASLEELCKSLKTKVGPQIYRQKSNLLHQNRITDFL
jgi:hypothetical protein